MRNKKHEKQKTGKGIAVLLASALLLTCIPVSAATVSGDDIMQVVDTLAVAQATTGAGLEYAVQTENGIRFINITKCPKTVKEVSIPSDIDGVPVTSIGSSAFAGCNSLTSITIPEGVTSIGSYAFLECSSLTSITIPKSMTSIGREAFAGCSGLESISVATENTVYDSRENCNAIIEKTTNKLVAGCKNTKIPEGVTSIGVGAFDRCRGLTSIKIPGSVTSIEEYAFNGCSSLTGITIPGNVTSIETHAFFGCSGLTSITIPNSVTGIGNAAFSFCSSLTSISVATENTVYDSRENCNAIIEKTTNKLVAGCKNTKIPNSVTSIGAYAFKGCSGLTSITIPGSVTSLGMQAFYECSGLTSITIPEGVKSLGEMVFDGCSGLTSITIPSSVTSLGVGAFGGCSSLTGITIPEGVKSIGNGAFKECSSLTSITIPKGVTSIGNFLFDECSSLTSIIIPESVTSIGVGAFRGCSRLTDVYYAGSISQWRKITIKDENSALTGASIHYNFNPAKQAAAAVVEQIKAIGTVTLEKKDVIDKARAAYSALSDDAKKYISDADLKLLTDAEAKYAQLKADKTKKEEVGAKNVVGNATYVVAKNQTVIYKTNNKKNVTTVKIPEKIQINGKDFTVTEIAAGAFKDNKKLTKVTIPKSIKVIGKNSFQNCSALKTVTIGSSVTTIADGAFQGCGKLTNVTIPAKVTKIGKNAFKNCKNLKKIIVKSTALKVVGKGAFTGINSKCVIKVPKNKLKAYKSLFKGKGQKKSVKITK